MTVEFTRGTPWQNWGRSERATPAFVARPTTAEGVAKTILAAREHSLAVKPIGAGHSFTAIAATDGLRLDMSGMQGLIGVDGTKVTLAAGTNLHQLPAILEPLGLALANMGDIDRQTVSGATSTGTHGTGAAFGGLATQISALTIATADGSLLRVSETENAELLPAATLGLGALGVIVDLTIDCVPAFLLQAVERPESFDTVLGEFEQRVAETDHFEFYVWPHTETVLTKSNTRLPYDAPRHPLGKFRRWFDDSFIANDVLSAVLNVERIVPKAIPALNRTSVHVTGNREFTDVSTSVFVTERRTRFREMEYAVPREHVPEILRELVRLIDEKNWKISFPIEVRVAAADDLWLSTASGRETGYIALHRFFKEDPTEYFQTVEALMRRYGGRPHWGKMHYRDAESLAEAYPRFGDFLAVRDRLDPDRVFANPYLERVLGA